MLTYRNHQAMTKAEGDDTFYQMKKIHTMENQREGGLLLANSKAMKRVDNIYCTSGFRRIIVLNL